MFHTRTDLIQIFSTFAQFEGESFSQWVSDHKLRRHMEACYQKSPQTQDSADFWSLYWYQRWKPKEQVTPELALVRSHLIAYLQETCYWASQRVVGRFPNTQLSLPDCFQIAMTQVDTILKSFKPEHSANLKSYAAVVFINLIKENLRQNQVVDICSPWALLRKVSQKRLVESLHHIGLKPGVIDDYILGWRCYKTIYCPKADSFPPTTRQASEPNLASLQAIASLYKQLHPKAQEITLDQLKQSLLASAEAIRNYLYPRLDSLNLALPGQSKEFQDYLPANESDSVLHDLIEQQEQQTRVSQQAQIAEFLLGVINQLKASEQQLLQLYYGENLRQQQIAERLATKQYTVSRQLSRIKQSLLLQLGQWTQNSLHISLTQDLLKDISQVLEEWLTYYYSDRKENQ